MSARRPLDAQYGALLALKPKTLSTLLLGARAQILKMFPDCNELLYHTHALTIVFSVSERMGDGFCMLPMYANNMNLGFNKGTSLGDPEGLLTGTGKSIRHIDIEKKSDYNRASVKALLTDAHAFALAEMKKPAKLHGATISKMRA